MTIDSLLGRRDSVFGKGSPLFYEIPVELVRGQGAEVWDAGGKRYLDMYNNVPCIGHGHPAVVEAMARQQATLNTHSRYLHEGIVEYGERLVALHGPAIENVIFSCTGTEANEVALHLARTATGRRGIVCTNATYHGNSDALFQLSRVRFEPETCPEIRAIPFPERYRPLVADATDEELASAYLDRLGEAIESLAASPAGFAGVLFCSLFCNEGLPDVPSGFMRRAVEMVHAAGGLVIADEVQAGFCRSGRWWGYEVTEFEPDIVVTGKPMGNGLPLAATAASRELVEGFRQTRRFFNTFAASPLQAAVGMAVLDVIESDGLAEQVAAVGAGLKGALLDRLPQRDWLGDVRGVGLFIGVEIIDPATGAPDRDRAITVVNHLKDLGFLTSNAGAFANVVKVRPPLVFTAAQGDEFLDAFDAALADFPITPAEITLVSWTENVTFRIDDVRGDRYVLRLHRPGYHSLDELDSERAWLRDLTAAGIAVPEGVPMIGGADYTIAQIPESGEQRLVGVSRWRAGTVLAGQLATAATPDLEQAFAQLGALMATMHEQASGWTPPAGFRRHRFDADGLVGEQPFWGRFWDSEMVSPADRTILAEVRGRLGAVLGDLEQDPRTFSLIHGDLHPGNLLLGDDGSVSVIDFDDAGFGWHQYDLAIATFHLRDSPDFTAIDRALIDGYRTRRQVSDEALALVPMFRMIRGLALIGWKSARPEVSWPAGHFDRIAAWTLAQAAAFVR